MSRRELRRAGGLSAVPSPAPGGAPTPALSPPSASLFTPATGIPSRRSLRDPATSSFFAVEATPPSSSEGSAGPAVRRSRRELRAAGGPEHPGARALEPGAEHGGPREDPAPVPDLAERRRRRRQPAAHTWAAAGQESVRPAVAEVPARWQEPAAPPQPAWSPASQEPAWSLAPQEPAWSPSPQEPAWSAASSEPAQPPASPESTWPPVPLAGLQPKRDERPLPTQTLLPRLASPTTPTGLRLPDLEPPLQDLPRTLPAASAPAPVPPSPVGAAAQAYAPVAPPAPSYSPIPPSAPAYAPVAPSPPSYSPVPPSAPAAPSYTPVPPSYTPVPPSAPAAPAAPRPPRAAAPSPAGGVPLGAGVPTPAHAPISVLAVTAAAAADPRPSRPRAATSTSAETRPAAAAARPARSEERVQRPPSRWTPSRGLPLLADAFADEDVLPPGAAPPDLFGASSGGASRRAGRSSGTATGDDWRVTVPSGEVPVVAPAAAPTRLGGGTPPRVSGRATATMGPLSPSRGIPAPLPRDPFLAARPGAARSRGSKAVTAALRRKALVAGGLVASLLLTAMVLQGQEDRTDSSSPIAPPGAPVVNVVP